MHTAAIVWSDDSAVEQGELENAAGALARVLGAGRPFSVSAGARALWAWISGIAPAADDLRTALERLPGGVRLTLGSARPGIAGFRDSHAEARAAQRLLMGNPDGPPCATYADVQVVSLASVDEPRAAAFITATLGDFLAAAGDLHETVRVYLQQDSNAARAAALLHTHRNTILKRVGRAEAYSHPPLIL